MLRSGKERLSLPAGRPSLRTLAARIVLDLGYILATPFVLLFLLVPSRLFTRRRYRTGLLQKLGGAPQREGDRPCLWIHAVSVGELRAALPLVEALRTGLPGWDLRVSTSTDTGQDLAARSLPAEVRTFYFPLDYGWAVRRALRRVRPRAVVLLELELWPNFLIAAREAGVPVLVANGRVSARSYPRYLRAGILSRWLFRAVTAVAAQDPEYARRFAALGVPAEAVEVLGNLKYDAAPADASGPSAREILGWEEGEGAPVLVGGCTHPGEEEVLLDAWTALRPERPGLLLVLAPRHIERAAEVERLIAARGHGVLRWSACSGRPAAPSGGAGTRILLVDTIGDLERFYRIADVVFVGGSLVPRGGHNLLEPTRLGKPVLFGPSVSNFEEIARHLLAREAALQVPDASALGREISRLLASPEARRSLGDRARSAAGELRGATARHAEWIRKALGA